MDVYCGIDWAEDHHDIAVVDRDGKLVARRRISDDAAGLAGLLDLLAEHGDSPEAPVPVAIETPRGLLVACLRATGRQVYPVNPMAVARYRDRHSVTGQETRPRRFGRAGPRAAHRHGHAPAAHRLLQRRPGRVPRRRPAAARPAPRTAGPGPPARPR